jgi:hypothetical protein
MIPRLTSAFYRLSTENRPLYRIGMPLEGIEPGGEVRFGNFRTNKTVITTAVQQAAFRKIQEVPIDSVASAVFCSQPDRYALQAACSLIRKAYGEGFREIEFVHPSEPLPRVEDTKALYVLTGLNQDDSETTRQARRWFYARHGASVWAIVTTTEPYRYCSESLGKIPEFLFLCQPSGTSVG